MSAFTLFIPGRAVSTQTGSVVFRKGRAIPERMGLGWIHETLLAVRASRPPAPYEGRVTTELAFRFAPPVSWSAARAEREQTEGPPRLGADVDNLIKGLLDGWQGDLYRSDNQIVRLVVEKLWADTRGPGVELAVGPYAGRVPLIGAA